MLIREHVPISQITTFRNAGSVAKLWVAETLDDAKELYSKYAVGGLVVGGGSNILMASQHAANAVVQMSETVVPLEIEGTVVRCSAGMRLGKLLSAVSVQGLSGLEFGAGVPACLGGMIAMNFGCWGHTISERVTRVYVMRAGKLEWLNADQLAFGYRRSVFTENPDWWIVAVELKLELQTPDDVANAVRDYIKIRKEKQPLEAATFGSVFKNPPQNSAGKLIEEAGLKGAACGDAKVSLRHANFIENTGAATFEDTLRLIGKIQEHVYNLFDVKLDLEVKVVS